MRVVLALMCALAASPVFAEEDLQWIGQSYDDGAALIFGLPESGMVEISLDCEKGSDRIGLTYAYEPPDAETGMELAVELTAGGSKVTVATKGERLEMDDLFVLIGETKLDKTLIGILSADGDLTVKVGDGVQAFPLAGAKEAAAGIFKTCRK